MKKQFFAEGGPCYPTKHVTVPEGWYFEVLPLSFQRGQIALTNGQSIEVFW